jgi:hypothetical protein
MLKDQQIPSDEEPQIPQQVLNVVEITGVASDFHNEFDILGVINLLDMGQSEDYVKNFITENIAQHSKKHYAERYPYEKWGQIINDKNREAVAELDSIIDFMNGHMVDSQNLNLDDARRLSERSHILIYGKTFKESREALDEINRRLLGKDARQEKELEPREKTNIIIQIIDRFIANHNENTAFRELAAIPEIKVEFVDLEYLKGLVSFPGILSHVTHHRSMVGRIEEPLKFWIKLSFGENIEHQHNYPRESAVSLHVTGSDNSSASIAGSHAWSLIDKNGQAEENDLIILSKRAVEKMAGGYFYEDEDFLDFLDGINNFRGASSFAERFSKALDNENIEYVPYSDSEEAFKEEQIAFFERIQLMIARGFDRAALEKQFKIDLEDVDHYIKVFKDIGYRYRGIYKKDDKLYWGSLDVEKDDVAAIAIPQKPGERYLLIRFLNRPILGE